MKNFLIPILMTGLVSLAPLHAEDSPLAKTMDTVDDAYKALRKTEDPAKGAELAREAQQGVLKAITMTPEFVKKGAHPAGAEKAMISYKKQMARLFVVFCEVEEAFLAKDLKKVEELVAALKEAKIQGHDEFMEEE